MFLVVSCGNSAEHKAQGDVDADSAADDLLEQAEAEAESTEPEVVEMDTTVKDTTLKDTTKAPMGETTEATEVETTPEVSEEH